jgi:broad specificity phosphatase PhoE
MKLVPLKKDAAAGEGAVMVSPEARQTAGIVAVPVERGEATRSIRSVGTLAYDERSLADVTTKYRAWIEKLDVDFTGREVHKGETLLELYAPDVFNAEAEYLIAANPATRS